MDYQKSSYSLIYTLKREQIEILKTYIKTN